MSRRTPERERLRMLGRQRVRAIERGYHADSEMDYDAFRHATLRAIASAILTPGYAQAGWQARENYHASVGAFRDNPTADNAAAVQEAARAFLDSAWTPETHLPVVFGTVSADLVVHHINGDPRDNRPENLRIERRMSSDPLAGVDDHRARARPLPDAVADEVTAELLTLARANDEAGFRELAALVAPGQDLDALWTETRRRTR